MRFGRARLVGPVSPRRHPARPIRGTPTDRGAPPHPLLVENERPPRYVEAGSTEAGSTEAEAEAPAEAEAEAEAEADADAEAPAPAPAEAAAADADASRRSTSARTTGATSIPYRSIARITSTCATAPTLICAR